MRPAMTDTAPDTAMPAEIANLVERLRERAESYRMGGPSSEHTAALLDEAASLIQSQAARIAELEAGLEAIAVFPNPPTVSQARARALLNKEGRG